MTHWFYRPAKWWQFWYPQSSAVGGIIAGVVAVGVFALAVECLKRAG